LLIESIAQSRPDSKDRLNRALQTLPRSLEQAYSFLYGRLVDQIHSYAESPLRIIAWLSYIEIPVTLTELRTALAVDPHGAFDKDNMITEEFFTECCAGLLTYDEDTSVVKWVHTTAEQYFKNRRDKLFPNERNEIMEIRPEWLGAQAGSALSKKRHRQRSSRNVSKPKSTDLASLGKTPQQRNTSRTELRHKAPMKSESPVKETVLKFEASMESEIPGEEQLQKAKEGRTNLWAGFESLMSTFGFGS